MCFIESKGGLGIFLVIIVTILACSRSAVKSIMLSQTPNHFGCYYHCPINIGRQHFKWFSSYIPLFNEHKIVSLNVIWSILTASSLREVSSLELPYVLTYLEVHICLDFCLNILINIFDMAHSLGRLSTCVIVGMCGVKCRIDFWKKLDMNMRIFLNFIFWHTWSRI